MPPKAAVSIPVTTAMVGDPVIVSPRAAPMTEKAASLLVMAIVGGAVIPPLMGLISDASSITIAMLVPAICFAVVMLFAWKSRRDVAAAGAATATA